METIQIKATPHTPEITIDPEKKIFQISGRSHPEEVMDVYFKVLEWVDKNAEIVISENFKVIVNLFYFNSPTARVLHKMFKKIDSFYTGQADFSIHWYYDNEEDLEDAKDLFDDFKVPFKFFQAEDN